MNTKYDIIIVGAGISGCTLAERYAQAGGKRILVIENRDHVAGNCYDYENEHGIRVAKYGPHYFRTNDEGVWDYVQKFSAWRPFEARCLSHVDGKKVPIPVNINTINLLFDQNIKNEEEVRAWLRKEIHDIQDPRNSEESALKRMGTTMYEKMFKNYTIKQWDTHPRDLEASVLDRIPVRHSHEDRYFTDKYQMYPVDGYTKIFENMLNHEAIRTELNTSWDDIKKTATAKDAEKVFFTGKIDSYFEEELGKLEYRSLRFEHETLDQEYFQDVVQENYPDINIPFTRIVEYKHLTGQKGPKTTIVREFPTWNGDPFYPVPSEKNRDVYRKYAERAHKLEAQGTYFVGRLANYKYFNMDQAFRNALDLYTRLST